jgi:hypothetical protein
MWSRLIELQECRKRSAEMEARWLNLVGWCLRPGFGMPADDWRVQTTWRTVHNKLMQRAPTSVSESIILWRRIAGGFTAGQQNALFQDSWNRLRPVLTGSASGNQSLSTNVLTELLRLVGSLEYLRTADKILVADTAIKALTKKRLEALRTGLLWTIGRVGCRVPVYATLQQIVLPDRASHWIEQLLELDDSIILGSLNTYSLALMLLARKTEDRYRDISGSLRERVLVRMKELECPPIHRDLVDMGGRMDEENQATVVGESLPLGFSLRE